MTNTRVKQPSNIRDIPLILNLVLHWRHGCIWQFSLQYISYQETRCNTMAYFITNLTYWFVWIRLLEVFVYICGRTINIVRTTSSILLLEEMMQIPIVFMSKWVVIIILLRNIFFVKKINFSFGTIFLAKAK